jgi:hypothetical protein
VTGDTHPTRAVGSPSFENEGDSMADDDLKTLMNARAVLDKKRLT